MMMETLKELARILVALALPKSIADRASALRGTAFLARAAIRSHLGGGKPFVLVNVGACDGVLFDDVTPWLHRIKRSRAVLVEPVPYNRKKLRENYPDAERHIIEPVVVSDRTGRIEMKTFDEEAILSGGLPLEFVGCSSVKETNLISGTNAWGEDDPNYERYSDHLTTIEVQAEQLDAILARNDIGHIDAFLVDCEGSDWDVFNQLDIERWRPRMIKIEIGALNAEDIGNTILKLKRAEYSVGLNAEDVWAFAD